MSTGGGVTEQKIGMIHGRQGDHVHTRSLSHEAMDIQMQVFGFKHPDVAESQVRLAWLSMKQGQASECQVHLERALDTGFHWQEESFLEKEDEFDAVRQAVWFREVLANDNSSRATSTTVRPPYVRSKTRKLTELKSVTDPLRCLLPRHALDIECLPIEF